ncbi:MAG: TlpA family protein disulfide reductase [Bacteroidales bacterium]|nr:TlpA family protein disulfide reductase [Bacteroidales bacterium]
MRKVFILAAIATLAFSCTKKESGYSVTVKNESGDYQKVILSNGSKENPIEDTLEFVNSTATFTGKINGWEVYRLKGVKATGESAMLAELYLENADYSVTIPADEKSRTQITSTTSKLQKQIDSLAALSAAVYEGIDMDGMFAKFRDKETPQKVKDSIRELMNSLREKSGSYLDNYLAQNPTSPIALYNAYQNIRYVSLDSAKKIQNLFAGVANYAESRYLKGIKDAVAKKEALAPGQQAPDFTLNDTEGKPVKLSDVYPKNKITMIDFWASWCGPCRAFNPTLTKIYAKYNKKGFGILGVSLDRPGDEDKWKEAIKKDKLVWQHVSDLKFWDCEAAKLYNISYIPQSYFVDSEGKILLASPSEEEIEKFLSENLK